MTALLCLLVGFLAGNAQGTLKERQRVTKLLASLSRESDREHGLGLDQVSIL